MKIRINFCTNTYAGVKKPFKFPLVPRASKVKFLLVPFPNNLSEIYRQINLH